MAARSRGSELSLETYNKEMTQQQDFGDSYSLENKGLKRRYDLTYNFMSKHIPQGANVLDLGIPNLLGKILGDRGYNITNTEFGVDLDLDYDIVRDPSFDVVTAFEIFEHMVAPFNLLREIKAPKLVASVPLSLWFTPAYWNENDPWDRHYHEFEPRQFDMLMEKSGWKIVASEKWTHGADKLGIRPILRRFYPRYYIVYCVREDGHTT